jgi:hypothetical protein
MLIYRTIVPDFSCLKSPRHVVPLNPKISNVAETNHGCTILIYMKAKELGISIILSSNVLQCLYFLLGGPFKILNYAS